MLLWTVVKVAFKTIRSNKLRSFLTILGVIIGVASVIAMLALGAGTRAKVTEQVRNFGANVFSVRPGYKPVSTGVRSGTYTSLKVKDAEAILAEVPEIEMVSPDTDNDYQVKYMNHNSKLQVNGEAIPYFEMRNWQIDKGRIFREDEVERHARVAVLGSEAVKKLFEDVDPIGDTVKIKGVNFLVIGVTKPKDDHDDNIWIPYTTAMTQLIGEDSLHQIYCKVRNGVTMDDGIAKVSAVMRRRHHIQFDQEDDFSIRNNQAAADSLDQVTSVFTMLLAGVAGISLLIGGINIMNVMLVTVTERTREIGIRKALGARHADVMTQFLLEALLISLSGGIAGAALGVGSVLIFNYVTLQTTGTSYGARLEVLPIVIAFAFSAFVGVFFGWYPARKAARLDPIQALRFE